MRLVGENAKESEGGERVQKKEKRKFAYTMYMCFKCCLSVCSIYTVAQRVNLFSSLRPPLVRSSPKVFNAFSMSHRDFYCRRRRFNCASIHCRGRDIICIVRVLFHAVSVGWVCVGKGWMHNTNKSFFHLQKIWSTWRSTTTPDKS